LGGSDTIVTIGGAACIEADAGLVLLFDQEMFLRELGALHFSRIQTGISPRRPHALAGKRNAVWQSK
jgi:hypothetical protein